MRSLGLLFAAVLVAVSSPLAARSADTDADVAAPAQYAVIEVVVHPLFQRGAFVKKVYENYDERLLLNQAVMDHVKYRLGSALIADKLFTSRTPLEIKFDLLRVDLIGEREQIDPVTKERFATLGTNGHAIAVAKLSFDKDGKTFERRYKSTEDRKLKFTSDQATNRELLSLALDSLIQSALSDPDVVEFLAS
ncbi:hypothetical protein ACFO5Q_05765 [Kordiimonas lipolytica]|uniref:ABC-type transport auxiliary lipoprotein component domain-containing protein n=1 Tax=Kordiimonas lipolytica TaxID=1662421 RepID=A0ABV8U8B8_9PROT|nr:hypothetical protein [Kordiimonas lipolytica]